MRAADLHRLRGKADAAWRAEVEGEAERIIALPDPADRMRAYAELSRVLAEDGETLPPSITDRIAREMHRDAETREREARRRRWEAERTETIRLDRLRPWAMALGVPVAGLAPISLAAGVAGWGILDVLVAVLEVPWLLAWPLAICAAAVVALGVLACLIAKAATVRNVQWWLSCSASWGLLLLVAARALPLHLADYSARLADGASIGGSVVRVERIQPGPAERIHILRGNGRVRRGQVLTMPQGGSVRWLSGS